MTVTVHAENLGVRYLFDRQQRTVSPLMATVRRRCLTHWGVRHIDLVIGAGEGMALLGPNGAGKSTLLRAFAGVIPADEGRVDVCGRVGSLLAADAGLFYLLTGRENCLLLAVLAGLSRREARVAMEDVKRRSGLGDAFDRPVSSFSDGMRARLGFATVERASPDVLLLDSVHESLDAEFLDVVEEAAGALIERGGIVVAAGHDHAFLGRLCTRAVVLERGTVLADGAFGQVAEMTPDI